jgi:8-oxo-dGTP diphosphatase
MAVSSVVMPESHHAARDGRLADMIVVAAAILRDARVLAAYRRSPLGWEFPGGKVEPGEDDRSALLRECREELGVEIVTGRLLGSSTISRGVTLRLYATTLTSGEPEALVDHSELRWVGPEEISRLEWLPADRPLLGCLRW